MPSFWPDGLLSCDAVYPGLHEGDGCYKGTLPRWPTTVTGLGTHACCHYPLNMADPNPPNPTQTAAEWRAQGTAKPAEQEGYSLAAPNPNLGSKLSKLEAVRADLGLNPNPPIDEGHKVHEYQALLWSRIRLILREPFAEFMGVFIMVLFGNGSVAQVLLSAGNASAPGGDGYGSYQSISWGCVFFSFLFPRASRYDS